MEEGGSNEKVKGRESRSSSRERGDQGGSGCQTKLPSVCTTFRPNLGGNENSSERSTGGKDATNKKYLDPRLHFLKKGLLRGRYFGYW